MIYLDHHAATPMPDAVRSAIDQASRIVWANPSSTHAAGRASRQLLEAARDSIAAAIGAAPADVVLTGGGTEACNLGVRAVAGGRGRSVASAIEQTAGAPRGARLVREGMESVVLDVPRGEPPAPERLAAQLDPSSAVAIQWVNHETGTVFPVGEYAAVCRERGARLFVDGTQMLGKQAIDVTSLEADAVALAGQKVGGPAGAGACWVRRELAVQPLLDGGSQERGRRPGTPDTLCIVGFGKACSGIQARIEAHRRVGALRDRLESALVELGGIPNSVPPRAPTVTNLSFEGWEGAVLVAALDLEGVCVSTGAACSSGLQAPSAVLLAMYPDEQWRAGSAVRISLGIETNDDDIDTALAAFRRVLARKSS